MNYGIQFVNSTGTIQGPDVEVLFITLGAAERRKPVVDEGSGMVLSGGYVEVTLVDNLEGADPVEGENMSNSE